MTSNRIVSDIFAYLNCGILDRYFWEEASKAFQPHPDNGTLSHFRDIVNEALIMKLGGEEIPENQKAELRPLLSKKRREIARKVAEALCRELSRLPSLPQARGENQFVGRCPSLMEKMEQLSNLLHQVALLVGAKFEVPRIESLCDKKALDVAQEDFESRLRFICDLENYLTKFVSS